MLTDNNIFDKDSVKDSKKPKVKLKIIIMKKKQNKKVWNMKVTIIPIVIGAFGTVTKGLLKGRRTWKLADEWRPSKLQHY